MSPKKHNDNIKIVKVLDESYKTIHIDGVYGLCNEAFGQILPYYDEPVLDFDNNGHVEVKTIQRHFVADLRMSPFTFEKIARQLHPFMEQDEDESQDTSIENEGE